jgi:hypothetical protein
MANEITVDGRGRTSFAKVRTRKFDRYSAVEHEDGTLVLTPLVTVPVTDLPAELSGRVDEFLDHPETGTRRTRRGRNASDA